MKTVLYIYGYHSGPDSKRALEFKEFCKKHHINFICPNLTESPEHNVKYLEEIIKTMLNQNLYVIGMSLGGRYVAFLAEKFNYNFIPILVSPAVSPLRKNLDHNDLQQYVDMYYEELKGIEVPVFTAPDKIYSFYGTQDEILDQQILANKLTKTKKMCYNTSHSLQEVWPEISTKIQEIVLA